MLEDLTPNVLYYVHKSCGPGWYLAENRLRVCDLTFVLEGQALYRVDGVAYTIRKGDAVFVHSGSLREAGNADMVCAAFNFLYTSTDALSLPPVIHWQNNGALHDLLRQYQKEYSLHDICWESKCRALFTEILCESVRCTRPALRSPLIRQMEEYILEHLTEPIAVADIAQAVGRHPNYCGSLFRKERGCTIVEYIHRLRLEQAVALMQEGCLPMGEIALQSGYLDIYYFSRMFKRYKGVPPSVYAASLSPRSPETPHFPVDRADSV